MDRTRTYKVTAAQSGKRLDRVLRELMPDISLGRIAKLVRKHRIRVNDGKSRHQQRLNEGDVITFTEAPLAEAWTKKGRARAMSNKVAAVDELSFTVLHEDEHLLAVDKPAGLLVHGTLKEPDAPTLIDQVVAYLAQRQLEESDDEEADERPLGEFVRPTPTFQPSLAHRIDRDTSGIVLIAKTLECLQELTRAIKRRKLDKFYIGLVKGGLPNGDGEIDAPIARRDHAGKTAGRHKVDVVRGNADDGKRALTRYKTLARRGTYSLVEFELITGRTHQIRAHLRHVGSALIGDDEYGDRALNRHAREKLGLARQFLHAARIRLNHPLSGTALDIVAPLPKDLSDALIAAGFTKEDLPEALRQEFDTTTQAVGNGQKDGA